MSKLNIYKKLPKKLKLYVVAFALTVSAGSSTLAGCTKCPQNTNTPTPTNIVNDITTPTIDVTQPVTPTATPTPTPIPHKTKQEVAEELKNVKVSVDDLMNEDVVYPTYFGAVDDNLTDEMIKRISYFESFGVISYSDAKILVTYLNYCYLNSDAVDKDKAEQFLSLVNDHNLNELNTHIIKYILKYNYNHPDNQIVISWGAIDNALGKDGRAVLNSIQKDATKVLTTDSSIDDVIKIINNNSYNVFVTNKDGSTTNIVGSSDDLNICVKYMESYIVHKIRVLILDYRFFEKYPSDEAIEQIVNNLSIKEAFSDPEHANVRRHGFDANAFYEEDLIKEENELEKKLK